MDSLYVTLLNFLGFKISETFLVFLKVYKLSIGTPFEMVEVIPKVCRAM